MKKSHTTRLLSLLLALVLSFSLCVPALAAGTSSFTDVKTTAWYYSDVTECAKLGIVSGFEDGTFHPDDNVTDVQLIVMLTRTFYNSKVEAAEKIKPAGSSWYWPNTYVADQVQMSATLTISDTAMTRYEMAKALFNVISVEGKSGQVTVTMLQSAIASIKDYNSIPSNRQSSVAGCYALGILTGMSDGTFSGTQSMNRAQACTVIMRMLKLINNYTPGGTSQTTGTLANGKPITVENVLEILDQIKAKYPNGTRWDSNTAYYGMIGIDMTTLNNKFIGARGVSYGNTSLRYACGGFATMVSNTIFGTSRYPFREVTDVNKVRPGDVVVYLNADGKLTHYAIVRWLPSFNEQYQLPEFYVCDGNDNSKVYWPDDDVAEGVFGVGHPVGPNGNMVNGFKGGSKEVSYSDSYYRFFTRYPD